jgi:peroxiredoxin
MGNNYAIIGRFIFLFISKAIHMDKEIPPLGGVRSKRYTMIIEDNIVKKVFEEPDGIYLFFFNIKVIYNNC